MGAFALMRGVLRAVQAMPPPLRRALDGWSQRLALRRRERRLRLAAQRPPR